MWGEKNARMNIVWFGNFNSLKQGYKAVKKQLETSRCENGDGAVAEEILFGLPRQSGKFRSV